MIVEVDRAVARRTVMETRLYNSLTSAAVTPPVGEDLNAVHEAYVSMAVAGLATAAQCEVCYSPGRRLIADEGVEAIILGGTDLALVFDDATSPFPVVNCAAIHVEAIVERAFGLH
jgi:aspartate racemase